MQGIYIDNRRPNSKGEIKQIVKENPRRVTIETNSIIGKEYGGVVAEMPDHSTITFVGPDPYTNRKFYGNITRSGDRIKVT